MKKTILILLSMTIIITGVFAACSKNNPTENLTEGESGIEDLNSDFGFEMVPVTDEDGKEVTDADGNTVTTEVAVKYELDKKGRTVAKIIDENGEVATNKRGKEVTVKTDIEITTKSTTKKKADSSTNGGSGSGSDETESTTTTTMPTKKNAETTEAEFTTKPDLVVDPVPKTSDKTEADAIMSSDDQQVIKNMLEVPYLYVSSYENSDGVPIDSASHAALWMLEREGISTSSYASGTVVIDLFKFYGQTVINFKTRLNKESDNENIVYNLGTDTFNVTSFEPKAQTVTIQSIERFSKDTNYFKVTGKVENAKLDGKKIDKVVAVFERNRLDNSLGFSLKAVKWS